MRTAQIEPAVDLDEGIDKLKEHVNGMLDRVMAGESHVLIVETRGKDFYAAPINMSPQMLVDVCRVLLDVVEEAMEAQQAKQDNPNTIN